MYSSSYATTVTMSDADSGHSDYSDYNVEKPILGNRSVQIPAEKRPVAGGLRRKKKKSKKNQFQGAHRRRKCFVCLIFVLFLALACLTIVLLVTNSSNRVYQNNAYNNNNNNNNKNIIEESLKDGIKIIVLNWLATEVLPFYRADNLCTVTFVNMSYDMSMADYYQYDVIILNSTVQNILDDKDLFPSQKPHQLVVFATKQPLQYNLHTKTSATQANWVFGFFHKSLSYSLKSDFHWQPYQIFLRNEDKFIAPSLQPQWSGERAQRFANNESRNFRYNHVFESSPLALTILKRPCHEVRKKLIDRLAAYMEVDTYGECGERGEYNCREDDCYFIPNSHGNRTYKFYLAFEEELCEDYVGENFYKALSGHLIPVVFGGAKYSNFAPPKSFINARDFASIRELAEYLLHLDKNPAEYIKYFAWCDWYVVVQNRLQFLHEICNYFRKEKKQLLLHAKGQSKSNNVMSWLNANKCDGYKLPEAWLS